MHLFVSSATFSLNTQACNFRMTNRALIPLFERQRSLLEQLSDIQSELFELSASIAQLSVSSQNVFEAGSNETKNRAETKSSSSATSSPEVPHRFLTARKVYIVCEGNSSAKRGWYTEYQDYAEAVIDPKKRSSWCGRGNIRFAAGAVSLSVTSIPEAWTYWKSLRGEESPTFF